VLDIGADEIVNVAAAIRADLSRAADPALGIG